MQLEYSVTDNGSLRNGTAVTISVSNNYSPEQYISKFGGVPEKESMEYEVNGLSEKVTKLADISSELMEMMDKESHDHITADAAGWEEDKENLPKVRFLAWTAEQYTE